jgi:methionyl-tRNA formyltransferase
MSASAVVFAYHDVGVRCLSVLLAHGLDIPLVVTHRDDPKENIWFGSVEKLARDNGLEVALPEDPKEIADRVSRLTPDFLFSFYYRHMLPAAMLERARRGAFNLHGSLLPKYRGRVPINWAVLKGERETGATLHEMTAKPDAGGIIDQMAVPILPDDRALDVFRKVTTAAEIVLHRALPRMLDGSAKPVPQDLSQGAYFGGRKAEDGRVDWRQGARQIHDLVRAVAPPYPGAFTDVGGARVRLLRTRVLPSSGARGAATLDVNATGHLVAQCADGGQLRVLEWDVDGKPLDAAGFRERFGAGPLRLEARA